MSARHTQNGSGEKPTEQPNADRDTLGGDEVREQVAKRAQWEDMTFALAGSGLVVVANESHDDPGEHVYCVVVEDGAVVECSCPYAQNGARDACKHRVAVAMRPAVMAAAEADDEEREQAEAEPVPIADGGQVEHADGCTDPACEGLSSGERRPELSFECWEVWAAEDHAWNERERRGDLTPSEQDVRDIDLERSLVMRVAAERGVR